jgi:hypothetical protein
MRLRPCHHYSWGLVEENLEPSFRARIDNGSSEGMGRAGWRERYYMSVESGPGKLLCLAVSRVSRYVLSFRAGRPGTASTLKETIENSRASILLFHLSLIIPDSLSRCSIEWVCPNRPHGRSGNYPSFTAVIRVPSLIQRPMPFNCGACR